MQRRRKHQKKDLTLKDQKSIIDTLIVKPDVTEVKMIISSKKSIRTQDYRIHGKPFYLKLHVVTVANTLFLSIF